MGKIGAYEYPDYKLSDCIAYASKLLDALDGDLSDENRVATILGHAAPQGGAYQSKMNSLERWGLIERGKRVTELAETILKPRNDLEKKEAVLKAIRHVKLFEEIYAKYQDKVPEENFWEVLVAITGVSRSEATKKEEAILKIYKDAINYLNSIKVPEKEIKPIMPTAVTPPIIALPTYSVEGDKLIITIPLNAKAIDYAIQHTFKEVTTWLEYAKSQIESKEAKEKGG
jgi:hypothetical protein